MTRLEGLPQDISHVVMFSDISERKRVEEQLRASVAERDALMTELSHRVKNNLAIVSSLISLKDGALGDAADLSDIQQHIEAVRSVYETQEWLLTVSNAGRPFPAEIDLQTTESLGLRLVSALTGQLNGELSLRREPAPHFTIRLPAEAVSADRGDLGDDH